MKEVHHSASLVDLPENEVKEFIGYTFQSLKDLEEQQNTDPEITKRREHLTIYVQEHYTSKKKHLKAQLKAARAVAKLRNIAFELPKDTE